MLPLPRVGDALLAHSLDSIQPGRVCQSNPIPSGIPESEEKRNSKLNLLVLEEDRTVSDSVVPVSYR